MVADGLAVVEGGAQVQSRDIAELVAEALLALPATE